MIAPRGYVILRPDLGTTLPSGLVLNARYEYPQSGWVVSSSAEKEDIKEGEFVLVNVESHDAVPNYYRVFEITLDDEGTPLTIFCDPEVEPAFVEAVETFRGTGEDKRITLKDLRDDGYQFLASDVLTYQWAEGNSPGFSILYPLGVFMFYLNDVLHYKVHEDNILAILEDW